MKKFVLMLAVVCACASTVLAQTKARVEIGLGMSRVNAETLGDAKSTSLADLDNLKATRVAAALEFKIAPMLYIAPGLAWHKGTSDYLVNVAGMFAQTVQVKAQMLSLPVSLGLRFKPLGILGLSVEVGPYASYLMKVEQSVPSLKDIAASLSGDDDRFSWGLGASVAAEISRFYLRLGLEHAMIDRKIPSLKDYKASKDYNIYLALGLRL